MIHPSILLSRSQMAIFLLYGIAGWFLAAVLIRWLGPLGIFAGWPRALTYLLIVPGTVPFVWLAAKLGRAAPGQLFIGFSISSAMATICDGLALWLIPDLYGSGVATHAGAGGTILWGIGVGIFLAYIMDRG